jgi:hypothetical protein
MIEETYPTVKFVYFNNLLIPRPADLHVCPLISVFDRYILAADRCVQRLIRRMSIEKPVLKEGL